MRGTAVPRSDGAGPSTQPGVRRGPTTKFTAPAYYKFESIFLHRRVRELLVFLERPGKFDPVFKCKAPGRWLLGRQASPRTNAGALRSLQRKLLREMAAGEVAGAHFAQQRRLAAAAILGEPATRMKIAA